MNLVIWLPNADTGADMLQMYVCCVYLLQLFDIQWGVKW